MDYSIISDARQYLVLIGNENFRNPSGPLEEAEPWCFTNDDLVRREVILTPCHTCHNNPYFLLPPGLRLAKMHSVQHVALRRGASNISGGYSRPLHRSLLHEKKGSSSKASHHASWVPQQVTDTLTYS